MDITKKAIIVFAIFILIIIVILFSVTLAYWEIKNMDLEKELSDLRMLSIKGEWRVGYLEGYKAGLEQSIRHKEILKKVKQKEEK